MFCLVDTESMDLMSTMEVDHVLHLITGFSFICGKIFTNLREGWYKALSCKPTVNSSTSYQNLKISFPYSLLRNLDTVP